MGLFEFGGSCCGHIDRDTLLFEYNALKPMSSGRYDIQEVFVSEITKVKTYLA